MAPPARAEAIPPAIAPNIITSLKWLETNNLFNNLIQRNQSAALDRKSGSAGMPRPISYAVFCLKKESISGVDMNGYYKLDADGVAAQKVTVVENRMLKNILMSR